MSGIRSDALSLSQIRFESSADQTLRNLMQALTLTYELRAQYRVFEYEATQEGLGDSARLFAALSRAEGEQIALLMAGLRSRMSAEEVAGESA